MSKVTKYLDRTASVAADAAVSIACGVVAFVVFGLFKEAIPLGDAVQAAGAGVVGAAVYLRARQNLLDPSLADFKKPDAG